MVGEGGGRVVAQCGHNEMASIDQTVFCPKNEETICCEIILVRQT